MNKNVIYIVIAIAVAVILYFAISPYERCLRAYGGAVNPEIICGNALKRGI